MENQKRKTTNWERKRGRPAGQNRAPLSQEERRARNAQYERERRNENAVAMALLAEALDCESTIPNAELLATAISYIEREAHRHSSDDIETLRRCNENMMMQIATLEERLANQTQRGFESTSLHLVRGPNKNEGHSTSNKNRGRKRIKQETHAQETELKIQAPMWHTPESQLHRSEPRSEPETLCQHTSTDNLGLSATLDASLMTDLIKVEDSDGVHGYERTIEDFILQYL